MDEELYDDNENVESTQSTMGTLGTQGTQGTISTQGTNEQGSLSSTSITSNSNVLLGSGNKTFTPAYKDEPVFSETYPSKSKEDGAKNKGELEFVSGVTHVLDDIDSEDYISVKELYAKNLGVTEYDELRAKLHLADDESFTDYYNRTGYIPKGFELEAQLLLAEEKRKKLYAQYENGDMSESDFLYEAYGKDLLKKNGVDFESPLYWYQQYKKDKSFQDPRRNSTFMLQLIEQCRELFQEEKWHEDKATKTLADTLAGVTTGVELPEGTVEELFQDQFDALTEAIGDRSKIIKYYRAGMLQGFDPTIDADGDGKIDYYLSTDGKLYNVNETGEGANTFKIYYKKDSNGNYIKNEQTGKYEFDRITAHDTVAGEIFSEFLKGIGRFFTDVVDFVALAGGALVDLGEGIFTGEWDTSAITATSATMGEFWNGTALGDHDLIQGSAWSGANAGRSVARLGGTIAAFAATAFIGAAVSAATTAGKAGASAATTGTKTAVAAGVKKTVAQKTGEWLAKVGSKRVFQTVPGKAVKFVGKYTLTAATSLTSWSNGAFGAGIGARIGTSAMLATRDFLTSTATLAVNQKTLGLSDEEVVGKAFAGAAINFCASFLLRQVADDGAMKAWSKIGNALKRGTKDAAAGAVFKNTAPTFWGKILNGTISGKSKIGVGIANTLMDQIENIITAGTQTSLVQTGDVWNWDAIGNMIISPQFLASSLYQTHMTLSDELKYDAKKLMGAIADTSRMDQEFRAYIAKAKADIKLDTPEGEAQLKALNDLLVNYDLTIKNKTNEINPTTGKEYSRAEATLFAIEEVVKNTDLPETSEFIQKQKKHLMKVVSDKKILYTQAVFNSLEENYKAYNSLIQDNFFNRTKAHWWYGAESMKLYEHFAEMTSKYMAIPLDMQMMYDTYGEDGYYSRLFQETSQLTHLDKLNHMNVSTVVTGVTEKDGVFTVHNKFDPKVKGSLTPEEATVFRQKLLDVYGLDEKTGSYVIITIKEPDGKSSKQSELKEMIDCLDATAETFNRLNELDPESSPLLVKLSDGKYVIPNFNLGNTAEISSNVGSLLKCMIHLKFNKSLTPEEQLKTVALILRHANGYPKDTSDMDIISSSLNKLPEIINALAGDTKNKKVFTHVEAARLLSAIRNNLKDGTSLPLPEGEGVITNNTYNRVFDILKVMDDYTKVEEALEVIRNGSVQSTDKDKAFKQTKEYIKASSDIAKFKEEYLKVKDDSLLITDLLQDCIDGHLFTKESLEAISKIPFRLDLKDQQLLNHYLENLETYSLKRGEVSEEEYRSFLKFMINKLGVTLDAGLEDTASLQKYVSKILAGRKATKKSPGVTKKQRDAIQKVMAPIIAEKDLTTKDSVAAFRKAIRESDIDDQIKKDLLSDISSIASIKVKALEKVISAYNDKNIKAEAAIIRKLDGYEDDPINTAITYLDNKYGGTKQQYKTVEDLFQESINKYNEVTKLCDENYIKGKNILVLDLTTMLGTEGEKVARKLAAGNNYHDYLKAEKDSDKESIIFTNKKDKALYLEEQRKLNTLYASRANEKAGDYVLVFDLDNKKEFARARSILKDIYNFNGDILYMAGKGEHPGIHLMSEAFIGFTLSNKQGALRELYVEAIKHQHKLEGTTDMYKYSDPLAILESFTSGYTFIDEDTEFRDASKIIFNTLQELDPDNIDYDQVSYTNSMSSWINYINVKLGKLAGNKVKEIFIRHSGIHLSTRDNVRLKQKWFLYKSIEAISKLNDPKEYTAVKNIPIKLTEEELSFAERLWSVDKVEGQKDCYYLNVKADLTPDDFRSEAYKILNEIQSSTKGKKGRPKKINVFKLLVPLAEGESLHNGMIRKSAKGYAIDYQETNGYSPYSILDRELRGLFTEQEIDNYLSNMTFKDLGVLDFTETALTEAEALLKTVKNPRELLNMDDKGNFFVQMQKNAVAATLIVSKTIKESLETLFKDSATGIYNILGDADNRRNLAVAIRQALPKAEFDEDGYLIVTDDLILNIQSNLSNIHSDADAKNATNTVYGSSSNTLTGSQTSLLKSSTAKTSISNEDLQSLLSMLNMSRQELLSTESMEDNPLMQLYAMCKAASDKDTVQISLQSLYGLSKKDIEAIKEPIIKILGKEAYDKLKKTIDKIHPKEDTGSDTSPSRLNPGEIKTVSRDAETPMQNVGESLKTTHPDVYQKALARLKKRRHTNNFIKLSDTKEIESNVIMSKMYADITNTKALVTKNLGSSSILNLNRTENVAALYYTVNDLANKLETLSMAADGSSNETLTREQSLDLAWNLMLYSTGTQFESNYPEFIFYDKKNRRIVNDGRASIAVSGDKYYNPYDNLIANIYHDYMKEDGTLDLDNIIIISADRNSFATLYTESPSNFRYLDMDIERHKIEELLNDSIKDFLIHKGLVSDANTKVTDEEKISEYSKYLYTSLHRTQAEYIRQAEELAKGIAIKGSIISIEADPSDLSFIGSRNNTIEELLDHYKQKILNTSDWNNRNKQQSKFQKTKDFVSFGVTDDVFNSYTDLHDTLEQHTSIKRKQAKHNLLNLSTIKNKKDLYKLNIEITRILDSITDAFDNGDKESFTIGIQSLCDKLSTKNKKITKEDIVKNVITYFIASSPYLENKIFMTLDGDYSTAKQNISINNSPTFTSLKTVKGKTIASKKYTKKQLLKNAKLVLDIEAFFNKDSFPFELAIAYDNKGESKNAVLYFDIPGIDTKQPFDEVIKQLRKDDRTSAYMSKYYDADTDGTGAKASVKSWYDFWNESDDYRYNKALEFNKLLQTAADNNAILFGFNSENFDIPLLVNKLLDRRNESYLNGFGLDNVSAEILLKNRLDVLSMVKSTAIKENIDIGTGGLTLSSILKLFNIDTKGAHGALSDVLHTLDLITKIVDNTIDTNRYQYNIINTIEEMYKAVTGSSSVPEDFNISDMKITYDKLSTETKSMVDQLNKFRSDNNRLSKIQDYINYSNLRSNINYSDIRIKEHKEILYSNRAQSDIKFAKRFNSVSAREYLFDSLSCAITKQIKEHSTKGLDINTDTILLEMVNKILPDNSIKSLQDYEEALSLPREELNARLNLSDEDIKNWRAIKNSENTDSEYFDIRTKLNYENMEDMKDTLFMRTANNSLLYSIEPLLVELDSLPIDSKVKTFIQNEMFRFFDIDRDHIHERKDVNGNIIGYDIPEANNKRVANFLSTLDQKLIDFLFTDPITSITYDSLYEEAQSVPLNHKIKIKNDRGTASSELYLEDGTIALSQSVFDNLFNQRSTNVSIETIKKTLGLSKKDDLYIAIPRHPLDKTDSFHFLKVVVLDDAYAKENGFNTLINADTMLTWMNGDLDGDHLTILKPTKELQDFANTSDDKNSLISLQRKPLNILSEIKRSLVDTRFSLEGNNIPFEKAINRDTELRDKLLEHKAYLEKVLESKDADITKEFNGQKEEFIEFFIEHIRSFKTKKKKASFIGLTNDQFKELSKDTKALTEYAESLFFKEPIEVSQTLNSNKRFLFFSDAESLVTDKSNYTDKLLYRLSELSTYGILSLNDTITGTIQKKTHTQQTLYQDMRLAQNLIRISASTKRLIDGNPSKVDLNNLRSMIKTFGNAADNIIKADIKTSAKVEKLLSLIQIESMQELHPLAIQATKNLKNSDTVESRAYNLFIGENGINDELFRTYQDIFDIKRKLSQGFSSNNSNNLNQYIIKAIRYNNLEDKSSMRKDSDIYKEMKLLVARKDKDAPVEDTVRTLSGLNNIEAVKTDIIRDIRPSDIKILKGLKNKIIKDPKLIERLGYDSTNTTITIKVINTFEDSVAISRHVSIKGQKVVTADTDATKGTLTVKGVVPSALDSEYALLLGEDQWNPKKMSALLGTNLDNIQKVYYDSNGNELKNVNPNDPNIAYEGYVGLVNMAECSAFWNKDRKPTQFEELSNGNNIDSIGGIFLYRGNGYYIDTDPNGKETLNFDNSKLTSRLQEINNIDSPARHEHNGMYNYLLLKLSYAINVIDDDTLHKLYKDYNGDKSTLISDIIRTNGFVGLNNHIEGKLRPFFKFNLDKANNITKAILSKELNSFMLSESYKESTATPGTSSDSAAKYPVEVRKNSTEYRQMEAAGQLVDVANGNYKTSVKGFKSNIDFMNKLFDIAGLNQYITRDKVREAETYGQLNNGIVYKRTQTSGGTRRIEDTPNTPINNRLSNTNVKVGIDFATPMLDSYESSIAPRLTDSEDLDLSTFYNKTNEMLNNRGGDNAQILNYRDSKKGSTPISLERLKYLLTILSNEEASEINLLSDTTPKNSRVVSSYAKPMKALDKDGNVTFIARRNLLGERSFIDSYNEANKIGRSSIFFDYVRKFKETNESKIAAHIPHIDEEDMEYKNNLYTSLIELANNYNNLSSDSIKQELQSYISDYFANYPTSLEEVRNRADASFYSGDSSGDIKHFKADKFGINQGLVIKDEKDLIADRCLKNLNTEASAKAQLYSVDLVRLNQVAIRNGSEEVLNKFAYVIALQNKLDVIQSEMAKSSKDSKRFTTLEEAKIDIENTLKDMQITDAKTFISDFEKRYTEEARMLYVILRSLNFEAEKYSKLCGEPGQNIFFLLTPSTKNTRTAEKGKAAYIVSMIARGNNPTIYDVDTDSYSYNKVPIYDGYNFFSSLSNSITAISKQAAIFDNSIRMKQAGFMNSAIIQNALYDIINDDSVKESIEQFEFKPSHKESLNTLIAMYKDIFAEDPSMLRQLNVIQTNLNRKQVDNTSQIGVSYQELFKIMNAYIKTLDTSLEDSVNIINSMPLDQLPNNIQETRANHTVLVYNMYSDLLAQLSYFTNDKLTDMIYNKIISLTDDNTKLVDKFGRIQEKDSIYALSENSLEYILEVVEKFYGDSEEVTASKYKQAIVTKALKGELYIMDSTLADTLANKVFVKKNAGKIKSILQKTSSWCTKWLMSNPFKLIDRFIKFTMFDTTALGSANHKTLLKQPQAMMDLRTYFSTRGAVSTDNLNEFLYTQGIKLDTNNIGKIFNNNDINAGFNPLSTYTDAVGNIFTYQTLSTRYAYWLATKEALEKGDYSVLGSAYYLKEQMKDLKGLETDSIDISLGIPEKKKKTLVTKAGEQAAFAMAQNLGAPGDFPDASRRLSQHGLIFTSFPIAAMRWGLGELRSFGSALQDIFISGNTRQGLKWMARNGGGIITTFILEQFLISIIADMFHVDEETEEEWKESGAIPNVTQTMITGTPIMDTFNSMNLSRELYGLTAEPFINKDNSEESDISSGFEKYFYKNILSHANPLVKNAVEVVTNKDLIDDQIIDTKDKYSMLENVFRKMAGYVIGAAGANAMVKEFSNGKDSSLIDNFANGVSAAISAEVGNTKAYKGNIKNYYKSLKNLNNYLYSGNTGLTNTTNTGDLKSQLYKLINSEAKISDVYNLILEYSKQGYSPEQIRSAMRACSLSYKLSFVEDLEDLRQHLSNADFNNIKTAIAFENTMYPWLNEGIDYLDDWIKEHSYNYYGYDNDYIDLSNYKTQPIYNDYNYSTNYNKYYKNNYDYYTQNPFEIYSQYQKDLQYQQQQAEYARKRKQWEDN